nr:hypothetical protein [uncultured Duganella sp.]
MNLNSQTQQIYGLNYEAHRFEQYKLYVESADRISGRRMLANTFFVGLHTALITAFTVLIKERILQATVLSSAPFIAALLLCYVWWRITISYQSLNAGKYQIIHEIEKELPLAPFGAEWNALGEGIKLKLYRPLTSQENYVPLCFGLLYISIFALAIINPVYQPNQLSASKNESVTGATKTTPPSSLGMPLPNPRDLSGKPPQPEAKPMNQRDP